LVKALDKSVDYLGKAAVGKKVHRPVENDSEYEMSSGTSTSEPTTKKTEKRTEQSEDESENKEVGNKKRYAHNAAHYPNRNRINKAEEDFELVEDSEGNIFAQDKEGNIYEVEEEGGDVAKGGAGDRFLNKIDEDGNFVEVAEGSDALIHLTKCLAETLDEIEAGVHGHLMEMQESQQLVLNTLQTHSKVFKAMLIGDEMKKSEPIHGGKGIRMAVLAGGKRGDVKTTTETGEDRADRRDLIRKAVQENKLDSHYMNLYAAAEARGVNGLVVIPDTILKSLGLEDQVSQEEMQKAQDMGIL
jgi:hypothetical protein